MNLPSIMTGYVFRFKTQAHYVRFCYLTGKEPNQVIPTYYTHLTGFTDDWDESFDNKVLVDFLLITDLVSVANYNEYKALCKLYDKFWPSFLSGSAKEEGGFSCFSHGPAYFSFGSGWFLTKQAAMYSSSYVEDKAVFYEYSSLNKRMLDHPIKEALSKGTFINDTILLLDTRYKWELIDNALTCRKHEITI